MELENIKINHELNIKNFINYCFSYIKLINPAFNKFRISTELIDNKYFEKNVFNITSEDTKILLDFKEFYEFDQNSKDITQEIESEYKKQKEIILKLNEIKDKFNVSEYTKHINLNFAYFKVEYTSQEENDLLEDELFKTTNFKKEENYPLFSIPIDIICEKNKYYIKLLETNIIPNIGFLQDILGQNRFYDFAYFINNMELQGQLSLPVQDTTIPEIWEELKGKLKLSEAIFDSHSFDISNFVISLSARTNYFLEQDYKNLIDQSEDSFKSTSLSGWLSDDNLNIHEEFDQNFGELFFPYSYNKYQSGVLSIIKNTCSVVEGPPGTGKSQTIANLLCHLAATGKKVLFVSQKAQAIKVVKDFLKDLNIEYLFGYIPNRYSQIYSQKEEYDSAAFSLQGIRQYLTDIHRKIPIINTSSAETFESSKNFDDSINNLREYFIKYNQLISLSDYNINLKDPDKFLKIFTESLYIDLIKIEKQIEENVNWCGKYIENTKPESFNYYDNRFSKVFLHLTDKNISKLLDSIISEIPDKRFERNNAIKKFFNKQYLSFSLKTITDKIPVEIFQLLKTIIESNKTNIEVIENISEISDFFKYKEKNYQNDRFIKTIELKKEELGLNNLEYEKIKKLISDNSYEKCIKNISDYFSLEKQLRKIEINNLNKINKKLKSSIYSKKQATIKYIRNKIKNRLQGIIYNPSLMGLISRIARQLTKSKRAYKTFDKLKNDPQNFLTLKEVIPVWIMDLEDVSRLIPLEKNIFDYLILDESSQCNISYVMPAMYRSKKVLFFGDSEQMKDDSIRFKTNKSLEELAVKFNISDHLQIKSMADSVKSVLDIATLRGFPTKILYYHYRSPKELIGFSNENFYTPHQKKLTVINSNYLTFKNTARVMLNHFIKATKELDDSEKTNIAEAEYICNLIKELKNDNKTKSKSIAVLTFFSEQAILIKRKISEHNLDDVKVSIIEGIQGDEKDIIIYSFVISEPNQKNRYIALTGEGGDIAKYINMGRINVAFSRARLQIHCVTSLPISKWPDGIWIKKFLEYVEKYGEIDFYNQVLNPFGSDFEENFYYFVRSNLDNNFMIQNQVDSCGFKIDFVITDTKTQKRLAIECDGPTHFEDECDEVYTSSDIERQIILESAGWSFYRISYSDWVNNNYDKNSIIDEINDYFKQFININDIDASEESTEEEEIHIDNDISNKENLEFESEEQKEDLPDLTKLNLFTYDRYINSEEFDNRLFKPSEEIIIKKPAVKKIKHRELKKEQRLTEEFEELLRFPVNNTREIVVSLMTIKSFIIMGEYLKKDNYTGFTKKNIIISKEDLKEFIDRSMHLLFTRNSDNQHIRWEGQESEKSIIIQDVENEYIDVRQFIKSANYTGFTKKGFRMTLEKYQDFIKSLMKLNDTLFKL